MDLEMSGTSEVVSRGSIVSVDSQLADPLVMDYSAAKSRAGNGTGADFVIDGGLVSTL